LERLPEVAAELLRLNVDVIVTRDGQSAVAAKGKTQTVPIVMATSGDALAQGLVASLARPGGNVTGVTLASPELAGKRLELLRLMFPNISRIAALWRSRG
jgi:putative ABC transport system substrate-binding protein